MAGSSPSLLDELGEVGALVERRSRWVLAGLLLLYLLLAALSFEPQPHTGGDNAGYIALAHSLLERHTYQDLYDPAEPPHTKYPPVFPLLLAVGLAVGLKPWVGLKLIGVALGAGAVAGTFLWLRRRERPGLALAVGLLLAISPGVLREVHWILSDVPFWCFTALALWAFERLEPGDWRRFALALLFTTLAYFTRSAGLPLVLAAGAWLAWRRHWRQLAAFLLVLGPLALAWWLRARATGGVAYVGEFWLADPYQPALGRVDAGGLLDRVWENLTRYELGHLPIVLRAAPTLPAVVAAMAVTVLALVGWLRALRRPGVAELFVPLYVGIILLWPVVWSGERFVLPVLGALLAYAGAGLLRLFGERRARAGRLAAVGAAALLALIAMPGLAATVQNGMTCQAAWRSGVRYPCLGPEWQEFFGMAERLGRTLPPDAVVLSRKPRLFYVLSGLQGRNYPMDPTAAALLASADSAGARWVVYDQLGGLAERYLAPALLQRPQAFCIAEPPAPGAPVLFGIVDGAAAMPDVAPAAQGQSPSFAACSEAAGPAGGGTGAAPGGGR